MPEPSPFSGLLAFAGLTLTWGVSFALIAVALEAYAPVEIAGLRLLLGAAVLAAPGVRLLRQGSFGLRHCTQLIPLSFFGNVVPFYLIAVGERFIDSAVASVLIATTPLWTILMHWNSSAEASARWMRLAAALLGTVGVALIVGTGLRGLGWRAPLGSVPLVLAAVCYAYAFTLAGRVQRRTALPSLTLASLQLATASGLILPVLVAYWIWTGPPRIDALEPALALLVLSVVATGLGYVLYHTCVRLIGASRTSMINVGMPLVSFVAGAAWLGEVYGVSEFVGAGLIIASLFGLRQRRASLPMHRFYRTSPAEDQFRRLQ